MTRDEFRALCDEILTPKRAVAPSGRRRPVPKFAFAPDTYKEGWIFHLWRPFLAVRISSNPKNGLMRFEPAFYDEIMKLPPVLLERALLCTVKHGFDNMEGGPGPSWRVNVEIAVMRKNAAPPATTLADAEPTPLIVYATATKRLVGEIDLALEKTPHPFRRITKLTDRGPQNAEPTSPEVAAMKRCWASERIDARTWLAAVYEVPLEWASKTLVP